MSIEKKYWFPAKRYGWGWGIPNVWQGWLVLLVFLLLVVAGAVVLLPTQGQWIFNLYLGIICAALALGWALTLSCSICAVRRTSSAVHINKTAWSSFIISIFYEAIFIRKRIHRF